MNRYQLVKQGLAPMPDMTAFMAELEEITEAKSLLVDRRKYILAGLAGDRTPDSYRRVRLMADLEGMAAIGGYVPDYFCDARIAEEFVEAGVAERVTLPSEGKDKRFGYRKIEAPF